MALKIFFSWQSDSPNKTNRNFIEDALKKTIKLIKSDIELEEVVRDEIELDMDTKGVPGSPPIVETIFKKISNCTIFVPDLTFVGTTEGGRKIPNPNVLIEYGWALKALSHSRIIPVMNSAFLNPTPEALPFDMRHLLMPKSYNLPEDSDQTYRTAEKDRLVKTLTKSITEILQDLPAPPSPPPPPPFVAKSHTYSPSTFINPDDRLATQFDEFTNKETHIYLWDSSHIFLRLMPKYKQHDFLNVDLKDAGERGRVHLLGRQTGHTDWCINEFGFVIYRANGERRTPQAVQLMTNGEIWAITDPYIDNPNKKAPVPPEQFEKYFTDALAHFREVMLSSLRLQPPFNWIAGLTGIKGRALLFPPGPQGSRRYPEMGPRYSVESIVETGTLTENDSIEDVLKPLFERIYGAIGLRRSQFTLPSHGNE